MHHGVLEAWRGEALAGYAIFRALTEPEPAKGRVVELVAMPQDRVVITSLLLGALELLSAAGVPKIQFATTVPEYSAAARRLGFRRVHEMPSVIGVAGRSGEVASSVSGHAFLSLGDGDWDQFPSFT
jgi:hypothetical protein